MTPPRSDGTFTGYEARAYARELERSGYWIAGCVCRERPDSIYSTHQPHVHVYNEARTRVGSTPTGSEEGAGRDGD